MAEVVFTGPAPRGTLPNQQFDQNIARFRENEQLNAIRRALSSGGTQQDQIRDLLSSNAGLKGFLGNAPAVAQGFELLREPVQPVLADTNLVFGDLPKETPAVSAPKVDAPLSSRELMNLPLMDFDEVPGIKEESIGGVDKSSKQLERTRTVDEAASIFDKQKQKPAESDLKLVSDFQRRLENINKLAISGAPGAQERAIKTLELLQKNLAPRVKDAQARIQKVNEGNLKLDTAKAKFIAEQSVKTKKPDFSFSEKYQDALLRNGIQSMEQLNNLNPSEQRDLFTKIEGGIADKGASIIPSSIKNVTFVGPNGEKRSGGIGYGVKITDPETFEEKLEFRLLNPDLGARKGETPVISSVVSQKPDEVGGTQLITKLRAKKSQVDSAFTAIDGFEEDFLKTLDDAELNSIISIAGGINKFIGNMEGALSGLEHTINNRNVFTNTIFSRPAVRNIVDKLSPQSAQLYASYAWVLYKVAIATQEGGGKALSDKDMDRIRPTISLGNAKSLRASLLQTKKNLRRDNKVIEKDLAKMSGISIEEINEAPEIVINEKGELLGVGDKKLKKPTTRKEQFKRLFK